MVTDEKIIPSDINQHLDFLEEECWKYSQCKVLELGVRGGQSTRAFIRGVKKVDGSLLSIDIDNCRAACDDPDWKFIQTDDIDYKTDEIYDIIFIDTSHQYAHTIAELHKFSNNLAIKGEFLMHDTMTEEVANAIRKFMELNTGWKFTNREFNNGLGTLKRTGVEW